MSSVSAIGNAYSSLQDSYGAFMEALASGNMEAAANASTAISQAKSQTEAAVSLHTDMLEFTAAMNKRLLDVTV